MESISDQTFHYLGLIWKPKLLLALFIFTIVRSFWISKRNNSPISLPVFGMLPMYLLVLWYGLHDFATHVLHNQNGTFTLEGPWFCDFEYVATIDPRNIEHIFKTNFHNFRKGQSTYRIVHDFLGDGFLSSDDDVWRSLRKVLQIKISLADFNQLAMDTMVKLVQTRLLPITDGFVKQATVFDLQDVLSRLFFDQNCSIAFGVDPGCLAPSMPAIQFAEAFKKAEMVTGLRFFLPEFVWKLKKYFNLAEEREMKTSIEQINEFIYNAIDSRKMELALKSSDGKSRSDFLSLLMKTKDGDGNSYPDDFLRDTCLTILLAGTDTGSVALTWFFWLLHQHPMVEKRIYAEICAIIGKMADTSAAFTPEGAKKMHYLHAALSESLRLYPPVPFNQTEVRNDDQLPSGHKVKKGIRVINLTYTMGRMESVWGEDCREFKPERWLRDGKFMPESQYKFPAFNAGLRSCLGKDLGYYMMKVVAASIIHRYRVCVVESHTVVPKVSLMLHMKYGLKVSLSRRNESESDYMQ